MKAALKYILWWFSASNSKGHGMHSPFVFDFIINVLNDDREFYAFNDIEAQVAPFSTPKEKKINQLFFRLVDYYKAKEILEINSGIGLTSAYLALADNDAKVFALENNKELVDVGCNFIHTYEFQNIQLVSDDYERTISNFIGNKNIFSFVIVGSCMAATLQYFNLLQPTFNNNTFFIIKDIYANEEAQVTWQAIQNNTTVKATIDLYDLGIVLFNPDFKVKQHFKVRF